MQIMKLYEQQQFIFKTDWHTEKKKEKKTIE